MSLRTLHRQAIDKYKEATSAQEEGNDTLYEKLLQEAFELEKSAAELLFDKKEAEPTRSILYRSAANLALHCYNYSEANKLAIEGLNGNPFIELKLELEQIIEKASFLSVPESSLEYRYLDSLRSKSVELKVEEESPKLGGAVVVAHIIDFLKSMEVSYKNFAEINFKKALSNVKVKDIELESKNFGKATKLLAVNLNFQSFGISIAADEGVMQPFKNFTPEYIQMRRQLFSNFKKDVLYPDYNNADFQTHIIQKYSEDEIVKIFSPVLNIINKKDYKISLTENNYSKKIKTFAALTSSAQVFFKPKMTINDVTTEVVLTKSIVEKIGKKNTVIEKEELVNAEFKREFLNINLNEKVYSFSDAHVVRVNFENDFYEINDEKFKIDILGKSYDSVIRDYHKQFITALSTLLNNRKDLSDDDLDLLDEYESSGIRNW